MPRGGHNRLSAAEHKLRGTYRADRHGPKAPDRQVEGDGVLFQRPDWPAALTEAGLKLRLLNRLAWTGGLTARERAALELIAGGDQIPGISLTARMAQAALAYPWLSSSTQNTQEA